MPITQLGDGIAIYGPVGPNQTDGYMVQIDNGPIQTFSAYRKFFRPEQMIFFATNIGGGQHTVSMQLEEAVKGELAIDYVNVYTTPSLGGKYALLLKEWGIYMDSDFPPTQLSLFV